MIETIMNRSLPDIPAKSNGAGAMLFVTYFVAGQVSPTREITELIRQLSSFTVHVLNLFEHRMSTRHLEIPAFIDLDAFDAIVIHNPVSYNVDNLYSLDAITSRRLADYQGVKILFRQDKNYRHKEVAEYIGLTGID